MFVDSFSTPQFIAAALAAVVALIAALLTFVLGRRGHAIQFSLKRFEFGLKRKEARLDKLEAALAAGNRLQGRITMLLVYCAAGKPMDEDAGQQLLRDVRDCAEQLFEAHAQLTSDDESRDYQRQWYPGLKGLLLEINPLLKKRPDGQMPSSTETIAFHLRRGEPQLFEYLADIKSRRDRLLHMV